MDIKTLEIEFSDIEHGWIKVNMFLDKKHLVTMDFSYVYNPFGEYVEILHNLKNKQIDQFINIDEEGPETHITFKNRNKIVEITIEKIVFTSRKENWIPKQTFIVDKEQFLYEFKNKLLNFYNENIKEFNNEHFKFWFNKKKLKSI